MCSRCLSAIPTLTEVASSGITTTGTATHTISNGGGVEQEYDCEGQSDEKTCKTRTLIAYTCSGYAFTRRGTTTGAYTPKTRAANTQGVLTTTSKPQEIRRAGFSAVYEAAIGSYTSLEFLYIIP